jgi:hypothetical protein
MNRSSWPSPSTHAWILVVKPPRERPRACSPFFSSAAGMLVSPHHCAIEKNFLEVGIFAQHGKYALPYILV